MISSFAGLNTSKLGIMSHQKNLYTIGHNISNAETEGYSRQVVGTVTTPSLKLYGYTQSYQIGTGVDVSSVTRTRDFLMDRQLWSQNAASGFYSSLNNVQNMMNNIFVEPSDSNLQVSLSDFWKAVSDLAANASNNATRTVMRQEAEDLVTMIKSAASNLQEQAENINDRLVKSVIRINEINEEILALNKQISASEIDGSMANDLRDKRDLLVDELSGYAKVSVNETSEGAYVVSMNGQVVVSSLTTTKLETYSNQNSELFKRYGIETLNVRTVTNPPITISGDQGSLSGLVESRDSDKQGILAYMDMLNDMSKALLCDFNQVHKEGLGLDNSTGLNFFGEQNIQYAALPGVTNPITGAVVAPVAGFDPVTAGATNAEKNWIYNLKVNETFYDPINGLNRIAAKTLAGNADIALGMPTRINSVTASAAGMSNPSIVNSANVVFKGPSASQVVINNMTFDASGFLTSADVSINGAPVVTIPNANVTIDTSTGQNRLIFQGSSPFDYNFEIAIDPYTGPALAAADNYTVTLFPTTGGEAKLTNKPWIQYDSKNTYPFDFRVDTTNPATGEITGLSYSNDGGVTWIAVPPANIVAGAGLVDVRATGTTPDGANFDITLSINNDLGNTVGDVYSFKMPPGDAANDNATRLAEFLSKGADAKSVMENSKWMGDAAYVRALGDDAIEEKYKKDLATLGAQTQTSSGMSSNQSLLVEQLLTVRSNYKDVNLDEELTNMIQFQKGYSSNARMLTALDEMLDKLINGTGRVGL